MARHLRPKQPKVGRTAPGRPRPGVTTPVVHPGSGDHYGWGQADLLCAAAGRPLSRVIRPCPGLWEQKASRGEIPSAHWVCGLHLHGKGSPAGIRLARVMRDSQLLPEDPGRAGRLSGSVLRGGGAICRRCASGLGVCRMAVWSGAVGPGADVWRCDAAASGRARRGLASGRHPDGDRDGRC